MENNVISSGVTISAGEKMFTIKEIREKFFDYREHYTNKIDVMEFINFIDWLNN